MAILEILLGESLKKLGARILGPEFYVPYLAYKIVDKMSDECRDQARQQLNCEHIERCPQKAVGTPTSNMIYYCIEKKGMAFEFSSTALCHAQADFDVKKLSAWVMRWDGSQVVLNESGGMHIQPCLICSRKEKH